MTLHLLVKRLSGSGRRWLVAAMTGAALVLLSACTTHPPQVQHSFQFDARKDSPGIEILDYRYGTSFYGRTDPAWQERGAAQGTSIHGAIRRGDDLYVKWRIKETGQVFEETVDLRRRMPEDITDHILYFIVRGQQLYVYLVTPQRRSKEEPPNGPRMYDYLRVITLHPDIPSK